MSRLVRGELDWIVMKALEKDRNRRYETANSLASDLRCYLDNEAVSAVAPSFGYRLAKFVRRNKAALATASAFVGLLIIGTTVSVLQAARATRLAGEEKQQRETAVRAQQEAEAVTTFLSQTLASADPYRSGRDVTVRKVLDQAAGTVAKEFGSQPLLEARLHETIGQTYFGLGVYGPAETHLVRAESIRSSRLGREHPLTLRARAALADLLCRKGEAKQGETMIREVLAIMRKSATNVGTSPRRQPNGGRSWIPVPAK